jgi:hypothetical protein
LWLVSQSLYPGPPIVKKITFKKVLTKWGKSAIL